MANKVVFLITDGYSNGGDPRPAANLLKSAGAIVFTFGIRTGNVKELHDIASSPGYLYSYLLDSFAEFEALVRHALHRGMCFHIYMTYYMYIYYHGKNRFFYRETISFFIKLLVISKMRKYLKEINYIMYFRLENRTVRTDNFTNRMQ